MSHLDHVFTVILAGGGGTRLWPKSRKKTPKQFLRLTDKRSMFQITADRFAKLVPWDRVLVITNQDYVKTVKEQLPELPEKNIIPEPMKKDTSLAMLVAALYAKQRDPEAILVNDAADHVVTNEREFLRLMEAAVEVAADKQHLVSVGIIPTYPSSAFGYIKVGQELKTVKRNVPVLKVDSFTEKPNEATARAFISTGKYFWNANNYVWSAQALQDAFEEHQPDTYQLTKDLPTMSRTDFLKALPKVYDKAEAISIDYAISEKADNLVLIPGDFGWDDIGEWKVVYDLGQKDLAGNVIISDEGTNNLHALTIESQNNLIHLNDRLIALIGINDTIVVDTGEIVMIAPKSRSQDVKRLVQRLKEEGKSEYL